MLKGKLGNVAMNSVIFEAFRSDLKAYGVRSAMVRAYRVWRMRSYGKELEFLHASSAAVAHRQHIQPDDMYFPISHKWYLCTSLAKAERIEAARQAYAYIDSTFSKDELEVLGTAGMPLWRADVDDHNFEIRLMFGNHNLYEGALSAAFFVDSKHVGVMSFSIVDGTVLGASSGPSLLLCRNQTTTDRWYQKPLQDAFKHIALPYMMLAGIAGIARALGQDRIFAVTEDAHPHADPASIEIMRGSYSAFWEKYQATPFKPGIVSMAVPLASTPLDQVAAKHRRRAKGRREVMEMIYDAVQQSFQSRVNLQQQSRSAPGQVINGRGIASVAAAALAAYDLILPVVQDGINAVLISGFQLLA